jgi:Bacterial capsule synthesis protein PGA_cap
VPLVPIVSFWSSLDSISKARLVAIANGDDPTFKQVLVPAGMAGPIETALGIGVSNSVVEDETPLVNVISESGGIGLLPLPEMNPTVRALGVDGVSLFGNDRIKSFDTWPLMAHLTLPSYTWDQTQTWTVVAGGDILLDRGVANQVTNLGKGVDFPWDGGTVKITGFHCCTGRGWPVVEFARTGHAGAVRDLFSGADIAMANLEGPVKDAFKYHEGGLTFTGDPRLLDGLKNAGLDFASLANNHIGNGGTVGLSDTIRALDDRGIEHAGAGSDLAAAAKPAAFQVGEVNVEIISCAQVGGFHADPSQPGDLKCSDPATVAAISAAHAAGAVVIVFPHWGTEYRLAANQVQQNLAASWAAAGANLVVGSHPHWAEGVDNIDGTLVFYCMGNLVFDQDWSENTMEGLVLEFTFEGPNLVQAWVHPTLILSRAQPNLLDFGGGGDTVLARIATVSHINPPLGQ